MTFSVAAIIIHKGKYLFQKRDKKSGIFYPNYFGLFGGNSSGKEKPKDTIIRELNEETNLKFKKIKHFLTIKLESSSFNPKKSSIFRRHVYICKLPVDFKKKIKLQEGQSFRFFDVRKNNSIKFVSFDFAVANYHYLLKSKKKIIPEEYLK